MFEKYPDQSRDRWHGFWIGTIAVLVSGVSFWAGWTECGFIFGVVALLFLPAVLMCGHAGFETAKKVWGFVAWFA